MTDKSYKEIAVSFLELVVSGKIREAYDKYVDQNFRHHNTYFRGDRASLMLAMEENHAEYPSKALEVKLTLEDGNMVAVVSHIRLKPVDTGSGTVHLFRFEGDLIVEMWDIVQAIPKDSPNQYGMF